ncbi:DUF6438 domain-containing protein [uncultured Rhodoblastus sp.]|uniref:DUF6438 domain-containing protein n=1 Tax=uncultured Rhodoblastus sp. TaxID=543037 RepID=UPI0025F48035|nr:DUF6438 domain-containing protein [uncultured Rhodoblastus sp.]
MRIGVRVVALLAMVVVVVLGATGDGWAEQIVRTNELPADTLIVLQRGACERRCAVYNLIVFADGSAIFDGRGYVRRPGLAKTKISLEALRELLDKAAELNFFELKSRYDQESGCDSANSDAPRAIITLSTGGKSNTIQHHLGCAGAESERLKKFEERIDDAVGSVNWVK